jgi:FGGY family of carbohydrate kinases, N-terminal domain
LLQFVNFEGPIFHRENFLDVEALKPAQCLTTFDHPDRPVVKLVAHIGKMKVGQAEIFGLTGIQHMQINTLFQLYSQVQAKDPLLDTADTLLMIPDLFHYWLSERKTGEYTNATTTQLWDFEQKTWATNLVPDLATARQALHNSVKLTIYQPDNSEIWQKAYTRLKAMF